MLTRFLSISFYAIHSTFLQKSYVVQRVAAREFYGFTGISKRVYNPATLGPTYLPRQHFTSGPKPCRVPIFRQIIQDGRKIHMKATRGTLVIAMALNSPRLSSKKGNPPHTESERPVMLPRAHSLPASL